MKKSFLKPATLAIVCAGICFPAFAKPIKITTEQINQFHLLSSSPQAGDLVFVGGIEISAESSSFGGISGLRLTDGGKKLFAVSDTAKWFQADIKRNKKGRIVKLSNTQLNCVCGVGGKPYSSKHRGDAEGLEIKGNRAFISFERSNRINGYDLKPDGTLGDPAQVTPNFQKSKFTYLEGLEALALAPKSLPISGKFIAIAENSLNKQGNHTAYIASKNAIEEFSIKASGEYKVTDATFLSTGELLVLERRFGLKVGVGMRIRKFDGTKISAGKILSGKAIMEAGLTSQIDNMEGIAAWKNKAGETIINLISDDNFNRRLQRTILLEFKLKQ